MQVAAIVEGYGDVQAVPNLVMRTANLFGLHCEKVHTIRAGEWKSLRRDGQLEKFLSLAASRNPDFIVVMLDLDDGCVVQEAEQANLKVANWLNGRTLRVEVVFTPREFETLFLQDAACLPVLNTSHLPLEPLQVRGAKERVGLLVGRRYKETQDQLRFTQALNLNTLYHNSRAFRRLCKAVSAFDYDLLGLLF